MKLIKLVVVFSLGFILTACVAGKTDTVKTSTEESVQTSAEASVQTSALTDGQIREVNITGLTRIKKSGMIDQRVLRECKLVTQYPELLKKHGAENGIKVNIIKGLNTKTKGYNLDVEYQQIISSGNAFIGHRKYTQMHITLYKDGKKISEASGARRSGGGAFGGYKGSCSVIGRTVEANAKDTIFWLKDPYDNARLGDL